MRAARRVGGVEVGGTKVVCAIAEAGSRELIDERVIPTRSPDDTTREIIAFFRASSVPIAAIGIGSFGPLDLDRASENYGALTTTPKVGWSGANLRRSLEEALSVPTRVHTDVIAAAIAERTFGAARDVALVVYITVGTGIGGGALLHGAPVNGAIHAEMGHMKAPRAERDTFAGICPFHRDCLEGLASGPAIEARWGMPASELGDEHPAWALEAHYLGTAIANLSLLMTPDRIVLGGGVLHRSGLIERARAVMSQQLNGYFAHTSFTTTLDTTVVLPALGDRAGVLGALCLARDELAEIDLRCARG